MRIDLILYLTVAILLAFSFYFDYNLVLGTHLFAAFTEIAIGIIAVSYLFKTHKRNSVLIVVGMIFAYEFFIFTFFTSWL